MEEYQRRVWDELVELSKKLVKLNSFLASPLFKLLSISEQNMLTKQAKIMKEYLSVLDERIDYFSIREQPIKANLEKPERSVPAENFVATISANVDNKKMSDKDFRQFIFNTLPIVQYTPGKYAEIVKTELTMEDKIDLMKELQTT